jgi:hypothetical protein
MNLLLLFVVGFGLGLSPRLLTLNLSQSVSEPEALVLFGLSLFTIAFLARRDVFRTRELIKGIGPRPRRQPEPVL